MTSGAGSSLISGVRRVEVVTGAGGFIIHLFLVRWLPKHEHIHKNTL